MFKNIRKRIRRKNIKVEVRYDVPIDAQCPLKKVLDVVERETEGYPNVKVKLIRK